MKPGGARAAGRAASRHMERAIHPEKEEAVEWPVPLHRLLEQLERRVEMQYSRPPSARRLALSHSYGARRSS